MRLSELFFATLRDDPAEAEMPMPVKSSAVTRKPLSGSPSKMSRPSDRTSASGA